MPGEHTQREILSQPDAWRDALAYLGSRRAEVDGVDLSAFDEVLFSGCGSTYHLATAAAALLQEVSGTRARALPASELWLSPGSSFTAAARTLLIVVSRSGTTTETLRAVKSFRDRAQGQVVTLSCYPEAALATMGDLNLVFEAGQERSVAQTRAFSTLYLATVVLAQRWSGTSQQSLDGLPDACQRLLTEYAAVLDVPGGGEGLDRFYFLGSGPRYGLACELSLKMKEMTLSHSEPFHFLEFRHGPQSMVSPTTLLVGLVSEANGDQERAVLEQMRGLGAKVLSLAEADADVTFDSGVPESGRNVLYLPVMQRIAFDRAIAKGLNPDQPHNLEAVVKLE